MLIERQKPMEQGMLISCLDTPDVFEAVRIAHGIGYRNCEISVCPGDKRANLVDLTDAGRGDLRRTVDDLGMKISALQCHMHNGYGDADAATRRRAVEHTKRMIDVAASIGVDIIHTVSGIAEDDAPHAEKLDRVASCYVDILTAVGPDTPRLALEPCFLYVVGGLAHTRALFERLGGVPLDVNYDPSHFIYHDESPISFIREYADKIIHAHSKDAIIEASAPPPGADQDPHYPIYTTPDGQRGFYFTAPGKGILDWDEIMGQLRSVGYNGVISLEQGHGYRGHPTDIARESYEFFRARYDLL